jgi:hypothetical protein
MHSTIHPILVQQEIALRSRRIRTGRGLTTRWDKR